MNGNYRDPTQSRWSSEPSRRLSTYLAFYCTEQSTDRIVCASYLDY